MLFKNSMNNDDGVSSVVGEMLILVITIILVGVFALSVTSILPTDRDDVVDAAAEFSADKIVLYHKGGDSLSTDEVKVTIYRNADKVKINSPEFFQYNRTTPGIDEPYLPDAAVFTLGGKIIVTPQTGESFQKGDEIRVSSSRSIIYAGVVNYV